MGGQVVRGVGGRRQEYRPIVSGLTASCRPVDVAEAFRREFGLTELYLADLDAIAGAPPAFLTYAELRALGFRLWVDAGVRELAQVTALARAGVERIVLGLETLTGPAVLAEACRQFGERVVFSLDLQAGVPLGNTSYWDAPDAWSIALQAIATGVRRLIVLDLARVGMKDGTGTEAFTTRLAKEYPEVEIVAGGGVRDRADLQRLQEGGVSAVLIASALHDGRLRREDLETLRGPNLTGR